MQLTLVYFIFCTTFLLGQDKKKKKRQSDKNKSKYLFGADVTPFCPLKARLFGGVSEMMVAYARVVFCKG